MSKGSHSEIVLYEEKKERKVDPTVEKMNELGRKYNRWDDSTVVFGILKTNKVWYFEISQNDEDRSKFPDVEGDEIQYGLLNSFISGATESFIHNKMSKRSHSEIVLYEEKKERKVDPTVEKMNELGRKYNRWDDSTVVFGILKTNKVWYFEISQNDEDRSKFPDVEGDEIQYGLLNSFISGGKLHNNGVLIFKKKVSGAYAISCVRGYDSKGYVHFEGIDMGDTEEVISEVINGDIDVKEIGCKPSYLNVDRPSSSSSEIDKFLKRQRGELEQFIKSVKK
nr:hypothetical protein CFP56_62603 [Quercus suber]